MSQNIFLRRVALAPALALAATMLGLVGCSPETSQNSASDAAAAAGPNAAASAHFDTPTNAAPAAKPAPIVCPKLVAPQCPPPAAPGRLAETAPAKAAPASNPNAAALSNRSRALWSHRHIQRHRAYGWHEHREAYQASNGHGELAGGPVAPPPLPRMDERFARADGFEAREESRVVSRSEGWRISDGAHREFRELRPCPGACGGPRHGFGYAGIDDRGYLVWPGKVEY